METYGRLNKICVPIHTHGLKLFQPGYKLSEFWKGKDWRFQGVKLGTKVLGYAVSNLLEDVIIPELERYVSWFKKEYPDLDPADIFHQVKRKFGADNLSEMDFKE